MNFLEDLSNLDINDIGRWPFPIQAFFIALVFISRRCRRVLDLRLAKPDAETRKGTG